LLHHINWLAVLVSAVAIFILGGLWYSKLLFARPWVRLMGKTDEELKASTSGPAPLMFLGAFVCGLLISIVLAMLLHHFGPHGVFFGMHLGALCWLGFAAPTSFANAIFSGKPKMLWLIDSGYNLVSFLMAGAILEAWR
jgi:hypothetical protein